MASNRNDEEIDAPHRALDQASTVIELHRGQKSFAAEELSECLNSACSDIKDAAEVY
jgi:hypothetical protein